MKKKNPKTPPDPIENCGEITHGNEKFVIMRNEKNNTVFLQSKAGHKTEIGKAKNKDDAVMVAIEWSKHNPYNIN